MLRAAGDRSGLVLEMFAVADLPQYIRGTDDTGWDAKALAKYAKQAARSGGKYKFAPYLRLTGGKVLVEDGSHRCRAAYRAGCTHVEAYVERV